MLIFDPNCEPAYASGARIVDRELDLIDALRDPACKRILWRGLAAGGLTVETFERVNEIAWAAGDLTLVWEEIDRWTGPQKLPPFALALVNQGRHRGVALIAASRRPARVSRDLTASATRIVAFQVREPRDVAYLREWIGQEADGLPGLDANAYECVAWTDAGGAAKKKSPFA